MKHFVLPVIAGAIFLAGCALVMDSEKVSAFEGHDSTVGIMGVGGDIEMRGCADKGAGYLACRVHEKQSASNKMIRLVLPPASCQRPSCIAIRIIKNGKTYSIPAGQGQIDIPLSDFIDADTISLSHDDEYLIGVRVYFNNSDGEHSEVGRAILRLLVLDPEYVRLAPDGPNVAWSGSMGEGCEIQYSTKLRSTLKGKCK